MEGRWTDCRGFRPDSRRPKAECFAVICPPRCKYTPPVSGVKSFFCLTPFFLRRMLGVSMEGPT